jgi:hypothetical protein
MKHRITCKVYTYDARKGDYVYKDLTITTQYTEYDKIVAQLAAKAQRRGLSISEVCVPLRQDWMD